MLIWFSEILKHRGRCTDIIARLGGEEFVIIMPNTDISAASKLLCDLLRLVSEDDPLIDAKKKYTQTCSAGLTLWESNESLKKALYKADKSLYAAKSNGRNRVEILGYETPAD